MRRILEKKIISALLALILIAGLYGCMPSPYSKELKKETEKYYLEAGKAWMKENLPAARQVQMYYDYDGSRLMNTVSGSFKKDGAAVKYRLNVDTGVCWTDERLGRLQDLTAELICARTGLQPAEIKDLVVWTNVSYDDIFEENGAVVRKPMTTIEQLVPLDADETLLRDLARQAVEADEGAASCSLTVYASAPEKYEMSRFRGFYGIGIINLCNPADSEKPAYRYEILNTVTTSSDGEEIQRLTMRRINTSAATYQTVKTEEYPLH